VTAAAVIAAAWVPPVPQDAAYHAFADQRRLLGIPNFWNVVSNLPFLLVGGWGLWQLAQRPRDARRPAAVVFCIGVMLVAAGSAWYHLAPTTPALAWDRLPMTVAFMALFAMVVEDRVSARVGRALLWPLVALGVASVLYWRWTEQSGAGDLRPYALVQFLPMLLLPLVLILYRGHGAAGLWVALAAYAAAKLAEQFDAAILATSGWLSGHSLKHLLAAVAVWAALRSVLRLEAQAAVH
jgi:hypothetical protein